MQSCWGESKLFSGVSQFYKGKEEPKKMEQDSFIDLAGIRINESFNEVYVRGEAVELSELEYQILLLLMRHPRKYFQRRIFMKACGMSLFL